MLLPRNDGNLTRMKLRLGMGPIQGVVTVVVNDIEIPVGIAGADMTATGWYNVVSTGTQSGAFDLNFTDSSGNPLGDPYGSMAYLSVVVPNRISMGTSLPLIQVLVQGMGLDTYDKNGNFLANTFTNNSAWVL